MISLNANNSNRKFAAAIALTVTASAIACVGGNLNSLLLVLLRAPDFVIVGLWLASALGWGGVVLKISGSRRNFRWPLYVVLSIAIGLGLESLVLLGLGLLGWISSPVSWGIVFVGLPSAIWIARCPLLVAHFPERPCPDPPAKVLRWLWLLPVVVGTASCVCALVPPGILWGDEPNGYDVLEYHLQVPREWFEVGRIVPLTHNVFSFFPFNVEMHYLLAMELRGGPWAGMYVAQLMHVAFVGLAMLAVYALVEERSKRAAVLAATLVGCVPWFGLLAPVAYNEGGLLLWGTFAVGLLLRGPSDFRGAALAGVMAGFASGAKLTGVPIVLIAAPLAALLAQQISWRALAIFWMAGIFTLSPWLVRNWVWAANPVFPEATAVFGRAHWSETQVQRWERANHEPRVQQQNLAGRLTGLRDQVIADWRFGFLLWPVAFVAVLIGWRERRMRMLLILFLTLAIFWTFFTHLQSRFFIIALPLSALMIGEVAERKIVRFSAAVLMIALIGVGGLLWKVWSVDSRVFGFIGVQNLEGMTVLGDAKLSADASVTLIGDGKAFWYPIGPGKLNYRTVFDVDVKPGESIVDAWGKGFPPDEREGVRVVDWEELRRFARTYWGIPSPDVAALGMHGVTIVREGVPLRGYR